MCISIFYDSTKCIHCTDERWSCTDCRILKAESLYNNIRKVKSKVKFIRIEGEKETYSVDNNLLTTLITKYKDSINLIIYKSKNNTFHVFVKYTDGTDKTLNIILI